MKASSSTKPPRKLKLDRHRYSLDVLTDGSECTGNGTVFLTVSRKPPFSAVTPSPPSPPILDQDTLLARYALSGISSLTSRIASDQAYKLSCVRAVFCPVFDKKNQHHVSSIAGMPSLLLSLSNYSMNDRLVVVGDGGIVGFMEHVADLVLKRRNYPEIVTCVVPSPERECGEEKDIWWRVYHDEYIIVYGRMVREEGNGGEGEERETLHIVYLVTLLHGDNVGSCCGSFAIFPSGMDSRCCCPNLLNCLPEEVSTSRKAFASAFGSSSMLRPLDFILHLNPTSSVDKYTDLGIAGDGENLLKSVKLEIHPNIQKSAVLHLATVPDNLPGYVDEGLLVRSLKQSRILNSRLSCAFPLVSSSLSCKMYGSNKKCISGEKVAMDSNASLDLDGELIVAQRLESFTSVILDLPLVAHGHEKEGNYFMPFTVVDRRKCKMDDIMTRKDDQVEDNDTTCSSDGTLQRDITHVNQEITSCYYNLHNQEMSDSDSGAVHDENEINLSDGEDDTADIEYDDECHRVKRQKCDDAQDLSECSLDRSVPYLLVLGTGCASPAPLRGSSGYGLFMPTMMEGRPCSILSVVLECGEGYMTMLRRHDYTHESWNTHISSVSLIWISHAHLDHYGDLPNLIHEIAQVKGSSIICTCYNTRQRGTWISKSSNQGNTIPIPTCNRCHGTRPTIVIAPTKVLRYLETALNCKDGYVNGQKVYVGINHRDFDCSPFAQQVRDDIFGFHLPAQGVTHYPNNIQGGGGYRPFQYLKNIQVDHCPYAYGCLLGLNVPVVSNNSTRLFTLCYSGDTRPSSNLVRACQDFYKTFGGQSISLLLHEATFDDDTRGKEEAIRKRHSTVQEALGIASRLNVDSLLLTHFSQRYPKIPPGHDSKKQSSEELKQQKFCTSSNGIQSASAFDGMLIPLKEDGLKQILPLIGSLAASILSE